jgi:hypothetical protein
LHSDSSMKMVYPTLTTSTLRKYPKSTWSHLFS